MGITRELCEWPMSLFYTYKDEIPEGTRVSTMEDCKKCDEKDCDWAACLISERVENGSY